MNINEGIIRAQADTMVARGLHKYGYQFINVDDGYFGGRNEKGELLVHKERFPNGMKALADYIHSKGLKAGIYSDAGINTCASYWDKDSIGEGMGLFGHEYADLKLMLHDWGYDFIKVDWCGAQAMGLDEETQYTMIGKMVRRINPDAVYNVCRWQFPGTWVTQVADSWRISGDIDNHFASILHIIDLNKDLWRYASPGHYNDMDMLQVGRGMTAEEDKAHFTMWCMMQSPLLLGNDLTTMSEETQRIITNEDLIAVNQSDFVYPARLVLEQDSTQVWARPMFSTMSGVVTVVLLNRTNEPREITLPIDSIGIQSAKGYRTKDLWTKEEKQGLKAAKPVYKAAPHGVVVLEVSGKAMPFNLFQKDQKKP